jgi:signal peptidase I
MTEARAAQGLAAQGTARRERRVLILVLSLAIPVAVVLFLCLPNVGPVFRTFSIPSGSMMPTLPIGSHIIVSRASYGYSRFSFDLFELPIRGRWPALAPQRGDVVVFRRSHDRRIFQVNRVVGLPRDRVQMISGRLSLNGALVPREPAPRMTLGPSDGKRGVDTYIERIAEGVGYRIIEAEGDSGPADNTAEFVVPEGHLFVLGDNRDNSVDSRFQRPGWGGVGFVPIEFVIGRVVTTF